MLVVENFVEKNVFCAQRSCTFCFQRWKGSENVKKKKRLNKDEVKQLLIDSLVNNDRIETEELNESAENVDKREHTANIIEEYEEILCTKRKGIITVAYHQWKYLVGFAKKKFVRLVANFKIHKKTIIFKINVFKLIQKYPWQKKSSVTLSFLGNYFKDKRICKQNSSEFEQVKVKTF